MGAVLIYGLINSMTLVLIAIGFSLTFGISGVFNMAYGAFYIVGGFLTWYLLSVIGLPYLVAVLLCVIIVACIGAVTYWLVLLRVRGMLLSEAIATFGIGIAILEFLRWRGLIGFGYNLPIFIEGSISIGDNIIDYQRLFIVGIGFVLVFFLWFFAHHTKVGLSLRAISQMERTALCFGIESDRSAMLSLSFGSALAVVAAITVLPLTTTHIDLGYDALVQAIVVTIVGGAGSTLGIIIASFVLGYSQTLVSMYVASHWAMIVSLIAVVLVLAVRPSGLFGKSKELEERV